MGAEIVSTFVTALQDFAAGCASTVVATFNTVMMTTDGKLSNLAIYGITLGAVGLGIGVTRALTRKAS